MSIHNYKNRIMKLVGSHTIQTCNVLSFCEEISIFSTANICCVTDSVLEGWSSDASDESLSLVHGLSSIVLLRRTKIADTMLITNQIVDETAKLTVPDPREQEYNGSSAQKSNSRLKRNVRLSMSAVKRARTVITFHVLEL